MARTRFDPDALDPEAPFEIDFGNRPHLFQHGYTPDDAYDVFFGIPLCYEADEMGSADWLMTGQVPGDILTVPLAPPKSGDPAKARPIGIYRTLPPDREVYQEDSDSLYGR